MQKFKVLLKELFLTKEGWISWLIANVVTSMPWFIPLALGFVLNMPNLYVVSGSIWTFLMLPLTPMWMVNVIIAIWLRKKVFAK